VAHPFEFYPKGWGIAPRATVFSHTGTTPEHRWPLALTLTSKHHYANSMRVSVNYAQEHFMELLDAVDRGIDVLIEASNGKLYRLELVERPTAG